MTNQTTMTTEDEIDAMDIFAGTALGIVTVWCGITLAMWAHPYSNGQQPYLTDVLRQQWNWAVTLSQHIVRPE